MVLDDRLKSLYRRAVEGSPGIFLGYDKTKETRLEGHIRRLEERENRPERVFSKAVRDHIRPEILPREAHYIILGESNDTTLWWTIAPYIFQALTEEHNISEEQAAEKLIKWASTAAKRGLGFERRTFYVNLEGLTDLGKTDAFALSTDQGDATHVAAREIGKYVVKEVILRQ